MNDKTLRNDPQTRAYMEELDARIDALESQLGQTRQAKDELHRVLDAIDSRSKDEPARSVPLLEDLRARVPDVGVPLVGRRWALGAAAAVIAVGAGLTFAGGNGRLDLPNAISLQDRVSVAEAADGPTLDSVPASDINVVPAPVFTLDASDSPFDDAATDGATGDSIDMTASFDSPDDSFASPSTAPLAPGDDSASDSPDEAFVAPSAPASFVGDSASASSSPDDGFGAPSAPAAAPFDDSVSASSSPDVSRGFQGGSPDSASASASFDSPDNT